MDAPQPDYLTSAEKTALSDSVGSLLDDTEITVEVTYEAHGGSSVNLESGDVTDSDDTATFQAGRREVTAEEAERSGGRLEVRDRIYVFEQENLPTGHDTPGQQDRIVEGGSTYQVKSWQSDVLSDVFVVVAA